VLEFRVLAEELSTDHKQAVFTPRDWGGSWNGKLHGTITAERDGWLDYVRLEDPPGNSPITTVGRSTRSRRHSWQPTRSGQPGHRPVAPP
jgi:hypothetical protein